MPRVDITEYESMSREHTLPCEPGRDQKPLTAGSQPQLSEPFGVATKFVMIASDVPCHYAFGKEPEVTKDNKRLWPRQPMCFAVSPEQRVAVMISRE